MKFFIKLALVLLIVTAVQSPAQYIGSARPLERGQTLDSLAAKADTLAVRILQQRMDSDSTRIDTLEQRSLADSTRLDSVTTASATQDTLLKNEIRTVADSTARDTIGGVLDRLKGTGVTRHLNPSDSTKIDSVTISSSGSDGGGYYIDYFADAPSDTFTVTTTATDFDLATIEWPGPGDGTVRRAVIIYRLMSGCMDGNSNVTFLHLTQNLRAKHEEGTWGVDDVAAQQLEIWWRGWNYDADSVRTRRSLGGLDISAVLADSAHDVDVRFEDAHTYNSYGRKIYDTSLEIGIRVYFGENPTTEEFWGYHPRSSGTYSALPGMDSLSIAIPDGATVESATGLLNVQYADAEDADTTLVSHDWVINIGVKGNATPDTLIVLPLETDPGFFRVWQNAKHTVNKLFTDGEECSGIVDGDSLYYMSWTDSDPSNVRLKATIQAGVRLRYSY